MNFGRDYRTSIGMKILLDGCAENISWSFSYMTLLSGKSVHFPRERTLGAVLDVGRVSANVKFGKIVTGVVTIFRVRPVRPITDCSMLSRRKKETFVGELTTTLPMLHRRTLLTTRCGCNGLSMAATELYCFQPYR